MKTIRTCALVVFLILALALPSFALAENCGWGRVQWGMSPDEVTKSTGLSITTTPKDKSRRDGQYYSRTELLGQSFDVYFKFDNKEKLISILLYSRQTGSMGNTSAFLRLKEFLAEKYGRPALWPESQDRAVKQYKWVTTCQVIDLSFIEPKNSDSDTLTLTYRPNDSIHDERF